MARRRPGTRMLASPFAGALVLLLSASAASAYPGVHGTVRRALTGGKPPTTQGCERKFGVPCYWPGQIQAAYDTPALYAEGITGRGQTIAIVDSFGSPTIATDLAHYDKAFGLAEPPSLKVIQPAGPVPPFDPKSEEMVGWAEEATLDVEAAHTVAPGASILLVETPEAETQGVHGFPPIVASENYVIEHHLAGVISQSFGSGERNFPSARAIRKLRSAVRNAAAAGVSVLAAAGDHGAAEETLTEGEFFPQPEQEWPSSDPLVTSVGGTELHLDKAGQRTAPDSVWDEIEPGPSWSGGGGPSQVFAAPAYQRLVPTGAGDHRATPDISMSASYVGGPLAYTSFKSDVNGQRRSASFWIAAGTSEATPLFAGFVALADQLAGRTLGNLNPRLYALAAKRGWGADGLTDVTEGNNTFYLENAAGETLLTVPGFEAGPGYDMASGLGTIDAWRLAHSLTGR